MLKSTLLAITSTAILLSNGVARAEIQASQIKLVRTLDGSWIACNRTHHMNRSTWSIENIEIQAPRKNQVNQNDLVQLKANVQFLQCQEDPEKMGSVKWLPGNPLAKFSKINPNGETYTMWHENLALVIVNLDNDELSTLKANPEASLKVDQSLRLGQLLTPSEIVNLNNGEVVQTSVGVFPQSSASVQKTGKDTKTYPLEAWGRFSIQFELQNN